MTALQPVLRTLLTEQQISRRVRELTQELSLEYADEEALMVGVLNGAARFLRDLERELSMDAQTDWIQVASYGAATTSSGGIRLVRDISLCVRDRRVLIVDDIVDSGRTLAWVIEHIQARGAADVKSCALLDKPSRRVVPVQADYVGFTIPDRFVVGYGLDWNGEYRDLPYIGVMEA